MGDMNELNDRIIRIIEEADSLYHDGRYAEAIECYERAAASDPEDTDALYMLYRLYRFSLHDYVSAEKTLLRMIALKPSLRYEYADMLLDSRSSVRDAERAAEMLVYVREHADLKDESENTTYNLATKLLGDCYRRGRGVPRDTERAIELYEEAAEGGNVPARHMLALLAWARGDGHETLRRLGMSDHKMSDGLSLALIGMILNDSPFSDVATDRRSAAKFFEAAAENGNAYAMCATGDNYRLSNFFGHDPAAAAYWYRQGALKGDIPAANNYGACWEHAYGVPRSYRAAAFMYELAGDAGFATATSNLARATERGRGLPADEEKAFGLYKKAALSDEPDGSMYNDLGACYKMEIGTAPDGEKEYAAFRLGTVAGDRNALHGYVMCLAAGEGVPEDLVKAEYLMSGMVRCGNYSGYYDLAYMFSHYPEDPAARRKTFEYYKLGAAHGDKVAAEELAWCYRTGYGVECDPERADVLEKEAQTMSEPDGYGHCDVLPMCATGAETNRICSSEDLFESFLSDICPDPETVQSWLYLIDSDPRVMRNVVGLALKITGEDDPASEGQRRKLTDEELRSLKDFVYLCCETELRLLVRYEGGAAPAKSAPDLIRGKVYPVLRVTETGDYIIADESGEDWTYDGDDFTVVLAEGESERDGVVQLRLGEKEEKRGDFLRAVEHYSKGIALGCDLCGEAMIRCYDVCEERERPSPAYSAANKPGSKELNCGIEAELWAGMHGYSPRAADLSENAALKMAEVAEHYRKAAEQGNLSAMAHLVHLLSANLAAEAYDGESRDLIARLEEAEI